MLSTVLHFDKDSVAILKAMRFWRGFNKDKYIVTNKVHSTVLFLFFYHTNYIEKWTDDR